ncbi:hypothetical protein Tco_0834517 [Tanacetum coccineum]
MLGPGRYSQWRSRFLRYIDTKPNGEGLRKSILSGPYVPSTVLVQAVAATKGNPAIQQHTTIEKEAIFLLLTGIGDDIYSTVNACKTANEMWIAIERLQQGESLNVQDVKTNLFWEFGKFTSRDRESMESYYSRFYKLMNELTRNNLQVTTMQVNVQFLQQLQPEWSRFVTVVKQSKEIDTISYHTLFDILKQYQNEVNDIRAERIAKSANPLALLAAAQPYSDLMQHHLLQDLVHLPDTKAKRSPNQLHLNLSQYLKKTVILNKLKGIRTCKRIWHSLQRSKRVKDYTYNKEKMMMCKQAEQGVPLQAEQADWLANTDEEIDKRNWKHITISWQRFRRSYQKNPVQLNSHWNRSKCKYQMQDKNMVINELKKHILVTKGKSVETQSDKPSVVRQPNAQRIPKPSVLGKPTPFSNSPEMRRVNHTNHYTSVSRPQLKSYQVKDKVVPNNSQVKFNHKEVEEHHRNSSISRKTKSVTTCNDSSKSRTLNVNAICAECVFNSNHDACVSRYLNNVNARTKKPKVVPNSASKPKRKANKSVATLHKKTVASDTTIQKSKSYYKELYENTNQEWKW